jgi:hypothetical protein
MALIEKYHVVAAERVVATGETIKEGQIVSLNAAGEVVLQNAGEVVPYGIAGDTKQTNASAMPGIVAGWQNRASDYFDETKASGKMTVYHSGGEFATDQYHPAVASATIGDALYADNGLLCTAAESTASGVVARLTQGAGVYPSGVPGIDINGDIALGGENNNSYIEIKLVI